MPSSPKKSFKVSLHDNHQIEITTLYPIQADQKKGKSNTFHQEVYFFLPKSLGINRDTYPKEIFYRSLSHFIRMKTPKFLSDDDRRNLRLETFMPILMAPEKFSKIRFDQFEVMQEGRLFGMYLNDQMKSLFSPELGQQVPQLLSEICALLNKFRNAIDRIENHPQFKADPSAFAPMSYIDEYLSIRLEEALIELKGKGYDFLVIMQDELARRDRKKYLQILEKSSVQDEEFYLYRKGRFKKFVSEVFYLEVVRYKREQLFTNLAAGLGAIVAAVITSLVDPHSSTSLSKSFFGGVWNSIPLVIAMMAIFYATKDRMKDQARAVLMVWFKAWIPDYNFDIKTSAGKVLGKCEERVSFTKPNKISKTILKHRHVDRGLLLPTDAVEDVIMYSRRTQIDHKSVDTGPRTDDSIKDILLFDFSHFLTKLSNPEQTERFVDRNLQIHERIIPRVYHVRLVIRVRMGQNQEQPESETIHQVRVIIDKSGIKRIENVNGESELSDSPAQQKVA